MLNDEWSTAWMVERLRDVAREEAEEGEFHPGEHTYWMIATRLAELEEIVNVLDGKGKPSPELVASLLTRIAGTLKWGEFHHKYTYNDSIDPDS
jgi:hypothetical protein